MAYGFEVYNNNGQLVLNNEYAAMFLKESGTVSVTTQNNTDIDVYYTGTKVVTGCDKPLVAIRDGVIWNISFSSGTLTFEVLRKGSGTATYYVFDENVTTTDTYGLEVFDSSGNTIYHSSLKPLKPVGVLNTSGGSVSLSSSRSYAAAFLGLKTRERGFPDPDPRAEYFQTTITNVSFTSTSVTTGSNISIAEADEGVGSYDNTSADHDILIIDVTNIGQSQGTTPTYSISPDITTVVEGNSVTFTTTTTNVSNGTTLYYSITTAGGISAADFSDSSLTGSFSITNNTGSFTKTLVSDGSADGPETFTVQVRTGSVSGTVVDTSDTITVNDPVAYTLTAPTSINEGSAGTVNVSTASYGSGTLYWKVEPATDFSITQGTVTITSNAGSFSVTPTADSTTEGAETGTVRLYTDSARTNQVATDTFTINDTSVTPDYTPSVTGTWSNISDTTNGDGDTGNVTLSDINQTINLYWTNGAGDSDLITVQYSVNGGAFTTLAEGSSNTVAVTNGQTLGWRVTTTQSTSQTGTITVKNASDSDATVGNTFTYAVAVSTSTVSTVTIGNNSFLWGYSTYTGTFGSISGYTAIGSDDIRHIGVYSFTPPKSGTNYYIQVIVDGNHSSTPNWTSIEFLDVNSGTSFNESAVTPSYNSTNDVTIWEYSTIGAFGDVYNVWNYFTSNNGNNTDVEWTI